MVPFCRFRQFYEWIASVTRTDVVQSLVICQVWRVLKKKAIFSIMPLPLPLPLEASPFWRSLPATLCLYPSDFGHFAFSIIPNFGQTNWPASFLNINSGSDGEYPVRVAVYFKIVRSYLKTISFILEYQLRLRYFCFICEKFIDVRNRSAYVADCDISAINCNLSQ